MYSNFFNCKSVIITTKDIVTANTPDWKKGVNNIFGSDNHTLTVEEIAVHTHVARQGGDGNNVVPPVNGLALSGTSNGGFEKAAGTAIESSGGSQPHNNVQMSKVKFIFTRIA